MHQPLPRFKRGDSVVYTKPNGEREVYTVVREYLAKNGIFYELKETDQLLPENDLEPYKPDMIVDVFLYDDLLTLGNRVTVKGFEGEFEIIGVEERYYFDKEHEHCEVAYYVQHTITGSKMFAAEEDVALAVESEGVQESDIQQTIDELLDEANDYRRLYEQFGDVRYKYAEQAAYEKLRKLHGEGSE